MTGRHRTGSAPQRITETSDYVAFATRIIHGYGDRIADDPAALAHLRDLQKALADAVNRGIFAANRSANHYSQNDMARVLGCSRQAIQQRIASGQQAYAQYWEARGNGALVRIADVRARRAELLELAGVEDRTGSPRELAAVQHLRAVANG